ncbi:Similar to hypothetical protein [Tuber melanosporum Mel28]; acc. no. XP_002838878 [Pyronema omphalodes CBS 100304]|uniref:Uncharacterized protein n=1 Tax=Pyronema omphalodes (strain CBS 100304) TaxID=1076935 RepID=U4LND1_PYROM|nr:Similar to hypothetical protein [Tuber melanosporum Mel28]; acc. no. XP_002838878 [Pyronema omphalodes CBS 100304]
MEKSVTNKLPERPLNEGQYVATVKHLRRDMLLLEKLEATIMEITDHDMIKCYEHSRFSRPTEKDRVNWCLNATEFKEWLSSKDSSILLINNCNDSSSGLISPMSYLCAFIAHRLRTDRAGPIPLLRSLIAQLIALCNFDFMFVEQEPSSSELNEVDWLVWLFYNMLQQLKEGTMIFFIIDNVSLFESEKDTVCVFEKLFGMTGLQNIVLKILVTSQSQDKNIAKIRHTGQVLIMPEHVGGGRRGTFEWDSSGIHEGLAKIAEQMPPTW